MNISSIYELYKLSSGVTTDSRNCPQDSVFFALRGDNFNGNAYAAQALEKGCSYAVVDDKEVVPEGDNRYILVDDSLKTLQQLASHHRKTLGTKVIGITGTNGKTTTKELIAAVLQQKYRVLYTEGNLNNHIGVPLTLLRLSPQHDIAVIEMGANHIGEINELSAIADPDCGIITNVGKAHLEGFGSFIGVVKTKGELYEYLSHKKGAPIFIDFDNEILMSMATGLNKIEYGTNDGLYVSGKITGNSPFLEMEWNAGDNREKYKITTQLIGEYNFKNVLAAITIGFFSGIEPEIISRAISEYQPQNNRSQLKKTDSNTLIIDAYNANPTSMNAALENFSKMDAPDKMLILGDMRELGDESEAEHRKIIELLRQSGFEEVILIGSEFASINPPYRSFANVDDYIAVISNHRPSGKTILIKGSNGIKLNRVTDYL